VCHSVPPRGMLQRCRPSDRARRTFATSSPSTHVAGRWPSRSSAGASGRRPAGNGPKLTHRVGGRRGHLADDPRVRRCPRSRSRTLVPRRGGSRWSPARSRSHGRPWRFDPAVEVTVTAPVGTVGSALAPVVISTARGRPGSGGPATQSRCPAADGSGHRRPHILNGGPRRGHVAGRCHLRRADRRLGARGRRDPRRRRRGATTSACLG
jgi:hypothetical protein